MPKKLFLHFSLILLAIAPPIIFSYEYGPDPGFTGAPGDNPTGCIYSGCHVGTPNSGPGSITIDAGGGTYVPGQSQEIKVTVADSSKSKFGFELTARIDSNAATQSAGTLATSDAYTQVITCKTPGVMIWPFLNCPSGNRLQWIEHNMTGFSASTPKSYTYKFNWTPPVVAGGAAPTISSGGIVPIFSSSPTVQPGSWVSVYGQNLLAGAGTVTLYAAGNAGTGNLSSPSGTNVYLTQLQLSPAANWQGDFPITLGGASVTIDGKPAYLSYASPTLINLQVPDDANRGPVNVVVTNQNGSAQSTVTIGDFAPSFSLLDARHVAAIILRSDGSGTSGGGTYDIVGPTGTSLGYPTVAAKAGDNVVLFGVGFGPTNPAVPAGQLLPSGGPFTAANPVQITINGHVITPLFAGLSGPGLFQLNIKIPSGLGAGDQPLNASVSGTQTQSGVVLALQ